MASALPSFASNKETTNYARLCRLLVDVGSHALRDTFDNIHPPAGLHHVLARHPEHATLQALHTGRRRVINPTQWGKLYPTIPSSVSSASFDITLLMILLRNICGLHPPTTGWDKLPPPADTSKEANIARVKYYRNTVYGHASQASVDDATFNTYWQDISTVLVALGGASYGAAINKLKNECMDPDMEEHYRELLKQWKKDEDSIKDKLVEIEGNIKDKLGEVEELLKECKEGKGSIEDKLGEVEGKMRNDLKQLSEKLDTFMAQREGSSSKDKDETRDDLKQMKSEIQNISDKLNSQMPQREETMDEDDFDPAELIDGIRQVYKRREGWLAPFPWCEEFHFHLDNIYTRLKVISRKKERGTATTNIVDMSGIFKPHEECSQPRTVLIEGTPGMGKTTYCKKLVYDWATGNQEAENGFPRFDAVLLLRCRDMKSDLWEAIDDQLLPRDVKEDVRGRFFDFIRQNQSNVLLILDGLDEVPANKLPIFSEIIQGRVLSQCHLVATSRHEAGIKVRIHCDTLLEIEGFTKEDAENFIVKYFKTMDDLAKKLLYQLQYDANLNMLARNPLNTALLCLFCEDRQGKFPKNRDQLYQEVVQCILRRYRKKEGLPETEDDLLEVYKTQLKHLGWIAFEGLRKDSLDFDESKLANHSKDILRFGFLSVEPGGSKLRPCRRYSFLHKSFQEWFAAFYLCCQLVEGICPDKLLNEFEIDELHDGLDSGNFRFFAVLCFVLNMLEARCEELAVALLKSMAARTRGDYSYKVHGFDWLFLAIRLIEKFNSNSIFFVKLARGFGSSLKCKTLAFDYHNIHSDVTISTIDEALKANTTVESVYFENSYYAFHDQAVPVVDALKENSTLTKLGLDLRRFDYEVAASFAEALEVNKSLRSLSLFIYVDYDYDIYRADDGSAHLAEALKVNKTLRNLTLIFFGNDDAGCADNGCDELADALKVNTTLTELILYASFVGDQVAARFAEALKVNKTLTKLELAFNGIGNSGAACLADALKVNTTLTELILRHNRIGDEGAASFAVALKVNKTLTKLELANSYIGKSGAAFLADALKVNTTLTELWLSTNSIGDEGAASFAVALKVNKTLTKLELANSNIVKSGAAFLADALKVNTTLTELSLSVNSIGEEGADSFAAVLIVNETLTTLTLAYISIGNSGAAFLADALKVNTTVTELNLNNNEIGDQGAALFAEVLKVNETLSKMYLAKNHIGNSGAACLADALKSNTALIELDLRFNEIDRDGFSSLVDALQHNTTLASTDVSLNPADFDNPQDKSLFTEILRLESAGRVSFH